MLGDPLLYRHLVGDAHSKAPPFDKYVVIPNCNLKRVEVTWRRVRPDTTPVQVIILMMMARTPEALLFLVINYVAT